MMFLRIIIEEANQIRRTFLLEMWRKIKGYWMIVVEVINYRFIWEEQKADMGYI